MLFLDAITRRVTAVFVPAPDLAIYRAKQGDTYQERAGREVDGPAAPY